MRVVHRWVFAAILGTSVLVAADTQAASTWHVALDQGERLGLMAIPEQLQLSGDAQPSLLYPFPREGRYRSQPWPIAESPKGVTIQVRGQLPEGTAVRLHVRGMVHGRWQPWQSTEPGRRLELERPAQALQLRALLLGIDGATPIVSAIEVALHAGLFASTIAASAPTYRIYATREGLVGGRTANGHRIQRRDRFVALPSWRVLNDRGERDYEVLIRHGNRSVVVPVWDTGPWNTRDDYWSAEREMWRDLPRGLPEAQAAFQKGYNGGRDQFGRQPNLPNGIDIADGTFWDDLGLRDHAWVEVTFLWLGDEAASTTSEMTPPEAEIASVAEIREGQYFVRWTGKDQESGIDSYDVQVRRGTDKLWKDWLLDERATEALFKAPAGETAPAFRVRARDKAGNLGDYSGP